MFQFICKTLSVVVVAIVAIKQVELPLLIEKDVLPAEQGLRPSENGIGGNLDGRNDKERSKSTK